MALPVAAASRQQIMAVSVLACERVLADLVGQQAGSLEEQSRAVLAQVPHAAQWARSCAFHQHSRGKGTRRETEGEPEPGNGRRDRTGERRTKGNQRKADEGKEPGGQTGNRRKARRGKPEDVR